jgi:hypothetical protein
MAIVAAVYNDIVLALSLTSVLLLLREVLAGFWSAVSGANDSSGKHTLVPLSNSSTDVCHFRTGGASVNVVNTDTGRCRSVNLAQAGVQLAEVSLTSICSMQ